MGIPATTPEFLVLLTQSNLLDASTLTRYEQTDNSAANGDSQAVDSPTRLAEALVRDGLLTQFQAQQLLQGKWRGFFIGRYKVLGMLGAGGMGKVFLCEHSGMRRQVAIKVLPPKQAGNSETVERFYREAQAIARLDHRNIIHAFDVAQDGDVHYLVMEYAKGITLEDCVVRDGPMSPNRVLDYLRQSAMGLQHAHQSGVVHRDIKPSNLLITENGVVKILDLGLAQFFQDQEDEAKNRSSDGVMGTVDYMAPEQALDCTEVDIRADIYSLGATFYFALSGRSPFEGGSTTQKILWHQVRDPESLERIRADLPTDLIALISRMMAKDPANRFQTPEELLQTLAPSQVETVVDVQQAIVDTAFDLPCTTPATPNNSEPADAKQGRRLTPKKIAVVLSLCLMSAAAGIYVNQKPETPSDQDSVPPPTSPKSREVVRQLPLVTDPRPVYLSEIPEEDAVVGRGQFGKAGSLGYDNRRITVRGMVKSQGLSMHPPSNGAATVRYEIRGRYRTLAGGVAINDTGVGKPSVGQVFVVKGDGQVLWESRPVRTKNDEQYFAIDLTGVRRLELEVRCPGNHDNAHAVWCDPKLLRTPPSPADLPSQQLIDDEGFIRTWLILSPVPNTAGGDIGQGIDKWHIKDEAKVAPKEGDKLKVGDKELRWEKVHSQDYFFDLDTGSGPRDNCVAYAVIYLVAPEERKDVDVRIGSDDGAKVYLNGKGIGRAASSRAIGKDQNTFSNVTLIKGVNRVVFKIVNGRGDWSGALRFVDKDGNPIPGLKAQLTP